MHQSKAARSLKTRYIIGLSVIALLVTASYFTIQRVISEQRNFAKLVNLAGHQSGLANRIAYFAGLMATTQDESEFKVAKAQVGRTINKMETAHRILHRGDPELGIPHVNNENLEMIYHDPMVGLHLALERYLERARRVYETPMESLTTRSAAYLFLTTYGPHVLEPMFDAVVEELEKIGRESILRIERLELAIWIAALVTLLLEAFLIFRPLEKQIKSSLASLEDTVKELQATKAGLIEERNRAQQYLDIAGVILLALDKAGRVALINAKGCKILERDEETILGRNWFESFLPRDQVDALQEFFGQLAEDGIEPPEYVENRILTASGQTRLIAWHNALIRDGSGRIVGTLSSGEDITERRRAEQALRDERRFLQHIIDGVDDPIYVLDPERQVIRKNRAAEQLDEEISASHPVLDGQPASRYLIEENNAESPRPPEPGSRGAFHRKVLYHDDTPAHGLRTFEVAASPLLDDDGRVAGTIESFRDISEHLRLLDELQQRELSYAHLAQHDPLTGLPNRLLFIDRLSQAVHTAHRASGRLAVLFIDLDGFKNLNDSFDHSFGDEVIKAVATRLRGLIREDDTIARMGGDEFTVILSGIRHAQDAARVAQKILDVFSEPFEIRQRTVYLGASIGISTYPKHGVTPDELIRNADAAMYRAKDEGRHTFRYYSQGMTNKAFQRIHLESDLRKALETDQFILAFQPQLNLASGEIVGLEALIRWNHPDKGMISPARFIPLAEESGLIVPIGEWVLHTACRHMQCWLDARVLPEQAIMCVNISARQFDRKHAIRQISGALQETGLAPDNLELEITESTMMRSADTTRDILRTLRELGTKVAIDDFGTGYSSLSHLKRLPLTKLKVDQSFVSDIPHDINDVAISKAIIALGKSLSLEVLAEGIETREQHDFLSRLGCDIGQGYLYSRPLSAVSVELFAREHVVKHLVHF